ncbi:MAG: hypothetical protein LCH70_10560 [Proteobacteria bacterium]|nr:hypothetical protein [Pseudomonadota bacterium]
MTMQARDAHGARATGWRWALWGGAALLLLAPWVAMRFTREVDWSPGDFVVFGAMLAVACAALELVVRLVRGRALRIGLAALVVLAFLLLWAQLAVGLFGPG